MKVLVLSPHPDDEALGCGGTLRKHVVEKDHVKVVFLTSGEQGGHGRPEDEIRRIRENEAEKATKILGIRDIEFWREKDGGLRASHVLTNRLLECSHNYVPDLIYVPNEQESHPDHRAAARLVRVARRRFRAKPRILAFEVWTPLATMDEIVDITPYIEIKLAAVRAYQSQCGVLSFDDALLGLARYRGEMFCWPKEPEGIGGKYAEVFKLLPY